MVIADDQDLVRSGLRMVLEARGIEVLGEAADGRARRRGWSPRCVPTWC